MQKTVLVLSAVALAALSAPATGHHSLAMYDTSTQVTMVGVVEQFEWRNPHSWLHIKVKDEGGIERTWTLESNSTGQLIQIGWSPDVAKPGDAVTVVLNPLRDGTRGGRLEEIQHPDGRVFTRIGIGGYDVRTGEFYVRP
jgi:uncharacterized membrane protein